MGVNSRGPVIDPRDVNVICGPSGVGKGTVINQLLDRYADQLWVSVSATTRDRRPGEVDGQSYLFLSEDDFVQLIEAGELLEWALVHRQARYGTLKAPVVAALAAGKKVILEIDLQGARQVRTTWPEAKFILLTPPSWEELVARLAGRGSETEQQQQRRLETAKVELAAAGEFDYVIVNDKLDNTVAELVSLIGLDPAAASGFGK